MIDKLLRFIYDLLSKKYGPKYPDGPENYVTACKIAAALREQLEEAKRDADKQRYRALRAESKIITLADIGYEIVSE